MENSDLILPEFNNPPVIEVYCRIIFEKLTKLKGAHIGLFWPTVKSEFPDSDVKPNLAPNIEKYGIDFYAGQESLLLEIPPLPRTWFVSKDKREVLQIQQDQLINNWRKIETEDEYPRYKNIIGKFEEHLSNFSKFLSQNDLGSLAPQQYELTYINHISSLNGWNLGTPIEVIFPELKFSENKEILSQCETFNLLNTYLLPDEEGRLYSTIRTIKHPNHEEPIIQFQLMVRGIGKKKSLETMRSWFDQAHIWIVKGFTDLTNKETQKEKWGRTR